MYRIAIVFLLLFTQQTYALTAAEVKSLDSLNLQPANIRINQLGYDAHRTNKEAFVTAYEDYKPTTADAFYLIDISDTSVAYTGTLTDSDSDYLRGSFNITSYYNSITTAYEMSSNHGLEHIYKADFSAFTTPGNYAIVCKGDTSSTFKISTSFYKELYTSQLKYMAFQRCGEKTWAHGACHTHDGEDVGHDGEFIGGWHDTGDHVKFSLMLGYRSYMLALSATVDNIQSDSWNSEVSSELGDGVPDALYELKQVSTYILSMYNASKEDGMWPDQMYHMVGNGTYDHDWWGRPEWQDNLPQDQGGRPRPVPYEMGAEVAAKYGATLALFSKLWKKYDEEFAANCLSASIDMYENYILKNLDKNSGEDHGSYYNSIKLFEDEIAAHIVALLYVTKDEFYKKELLENTTHGTNEVYKVNAALFKAGWFAHRGDIEFHPGSWPSDWENIYLPVLFSFKTLILNDVEIAKTYGFTENEYNEYSIRTAHAMLKNMEASGYLKDANDITAGVNFDGAPYNEPGIDMAWGANLYSTRTSISGYLFNVAFAKQTFNVTTDLTSTTSYTGKTSADFSNSQWLTTETDSYIDYLLGKNPWDVSLISGLGTKEPNHVHNRTANSEIVSDISLNYDYTTPIGGVYSGLSLPASSSTNTALTIKVDAFEYTASYVDMSPFLLLYSILKMNGSEVTAVKDDRVTLVKNSKIIYAPNPVVNTLTFTSSYNEDMSAELYILSTAETVIYTESITNLNSYKSDIAVSHLGIGTYYLVVKSGGRVIYKDIFYKK